MVLAKKMICRRCRKHLIAAAADNPRLASPIFSDDATALAAHFSNCPSCRQFFSEQRALFAHLDTALAAMVSVSAPAAIAARTRQQIASEPPPRSLFQGGWLPLSGAALAALTLLAILFVQNHGRFTARSTGPHRIAELGPDGNSATRATEAPRRTLTSVQSGHTTPIRHVQLHYSAALAAKFVSSREPVVIVSPDQAQAIAHLMATRHTRSAGSPALFDLEQSLAPSELLIEPLAIKPLVPVSDTSGDASSGDSDDHKPSTGGIR